MIWYLVYTESIFPGNSGRLVLRSARTEHTLFYFFDRKPIQKNPNKITINFKPNRWFIIHSFFAFISIIWNRVLIKVPEPSIPAYICKSDKSGIFAEKLSCSHLQRNVCPAIYVLFRSHSYVLSPFNVY